MTEFTFAPGEKNIIGDRFSPSVIIFWLKTSIAASSTRIQYTTPNTLFGLIPLGADTKTIPLRGQRHQESMDMAQKQYTAQTRSVLIQQQMLDQQRKATADDNPSMPTE